MGQTITLQGVTYMIPERKEKGWGSEMTTYMREVGEELETLIVATGGGLIPNVGTTTTTATISNSDTITQTHGRHRIEGDSSPATLDSGTAINDGATDGNILYLQGTHDTNTVTVPDGANTKLPGGNCTLRDGDILQLAWDSTLGLWVEVSRSN